MWENILIKVHLWTMRQRQHWRNWKEVQRISPAVLPAVLCFYFIFLLFSISLLFANTCHCSIVLTFPLIVHPSVSVKSTMTSRPQRLPIGWFCFRLFSNFSFYLVLYNALHNQSISFSPRSSFFLDLLWG